MTVQINQLLQSTQPIPSARSRDPLGANPSGDSFQKSLSSNDLYLDKARTPKSDTPRPSQTREPSAATRPRDISTEYQRDHHGVDESPNPSKSTPLSKDKSLQKSSDSPEQTAPVTDDLHSHRGTPDLDRLATLVEEEVLSAVASQSADIANSSADSAGSTTIEFVEQATRDEIPVDVAPPNIEVKSLVQETTQTSTSNPTVQSPGGHDKVATTLNPPVGQAVQAEGEQLSGAINPDTDNPDTDKEVNRDTSRSNQSIELAKAAYNRPELSTPDVQNASQSQPTGKSTSTDIVAPTSHLGELEISTRDSQPGHTTTESVASATSGDRAGSDSQSDPDGGQSSRFTAGDKIATATRVVDGHVATTSSDGGGTPTAQQAAAPPSPLSVMTQLDSPSHVQSSPVLPDTDTTDSDPNVARVMRGVRGVINQNGGSVKVRLNPPELGVVRVQMKIDHGTVVAQLQAEHESARTLLTHQLSQLRHALESHGLTVDKLDVQAMPQSSSGHATNGEDGTEQSAADGRSRGRFGESPSGDQSKDQAAGGADQQQNDSTRNQRLSGFEQALNMVA